MPILLRENERLKTIVQQHKNDNKCLDWFHEVMELGLDVKLIAEDYSKLQKQHKSLQELHTAQVAKLKKKVSKL